MKLLFFLIGLTNIWLSFFIAPTYGRVSETCVKVIFIHIPKTGGSTVDEFFERSLARHGFVIGPQHGKGIPSGAFLKVFMEEEERNPRQTPLRYMAFHVRSPILINFLPTLVKLKELYAKHNCKFILATIVRNPISAAKSAFKFYTERSANHAKIGPFSWEKYEKLMVSDFQAQFFKSPIIYSWDPFYPLWKDNEKYSQVQQSDMQNITEIIQAIDIVGITEDIPGFLGYLSKEIGYNRCRFKSTNVHNAQKTVVVDRSQNATLNEVTRKMLSLDQQLYDVAAARWSETLRVKCPQEDCRPCAPRLKNILRES